MNSSRTPKKKKKGLKLLLSSFKGNRVVDRTEKLKEILMLKVNEAIEFRQRSIERHNEDLREQLKSKRSPAKESSKISDERKKSLILSSLNSIFGKE